jgi:hypothetical protein
MHIASSMAKLCLYATLRGAYDSWRCSDAPQRSQQEGRNGREKLGDLKRLRGALTELVRGGEILALTGLGLRRFGGFLRRAVVVCVAALGVTASGLHVGADAPADARKQPMKFAFVTEGSDCTVSICRSWIAASGTITSDTPATFDAFARERDVHGATVVLDSSGGSVLDAIALGRKFRELGIMTTVGATVDKADSSGRRVRAGIEPRAACESMCVFVLLSGTKRFVPAEARIRVHQIWLGDRANDPKAATYNAQDLMIVQRDIGRLTSYAFEMGVPGELMALALSVPPWEPLYQLNTDELRRLKVSTAERLSDVLPDRVPAVAAAPGTTVGGALVAKPVQDRLPVETKVETKQTAEAVVRTGGAATPQQ